MWLCVRVRLTLTLHNNHWRLPNTFVYQFSLTRLWSTCGKYFKYLPLVLHAGIIFQTIITIVTSFTNQSWWDLNLDLMVRTIISLHMKALQSYEHGEVHMQYYHFMPSKVMKPPRCKGAMEDKKNNRNSNKMNKIQGDIWWLHLIFYILLLIGKQETGRVS